MKAYGYEVSEAQIAAALADCRARGEISLSVLTGALRRQGVPENAMRDGREVYEHAIAYRIADRVLQRGCKAGTLRYFKGRWYFTDGAPV